MTNLNKIKGNLLNRDCVLVAELLDWLITNKTPNLTISRINVLSTKTLVYAVKEYAKQKTLKLKYFADLETLGFCYNLRRRAIYKFGQSAIVENQVSKSFDLILENQKIEYLSELAYELVGYINLPKRNSKKLNSLISEIADELIKIKLVI